MTNLLADSQIMFSAIKPFLSTVKHNSCCRTLFSICETTAFTASETTVKSFVSCKLSKIDQTHWPLKSVFMPSFRTFYNQTSAVSSLNLESKSNFLKQKIDELVMKYEQITGMDEVRIAQNRVIEAQDKFVLAQEKRRDLVKELSSIQNKLKEVYTELDATTRGEERYLKLVTKEHNLLKEEKKLTAQFNLCEREERDCFNLLSSSVKESHEKERAQAERTKYWSVIGSVIGTVIGVVGSSVNNEFKMRELRKLIKESAAHNQKAAEVDKLAAEILSRHEQQLSQIVGEIKEINHSHHEQLNGSTLSRMLYNVDNQSQQGGEMPIQLLLEEQKKETRLVLGFAIIVIPIVVACMNKML